MGSEKESATSSSSNDTAMWVQRNEEARKEREAKMGAEASSRKTDDQNRSGKGSEKNEETYSNNNKRVSFTKNLPRGSYEKLTEEEENAAKRRSTLEVLKEQSEAWKSGDFEKSEMGGDKDGEKRSTE